MYTLLQTRISTLCDFIFYLTLNATIHETVSTFTFGAWRHFTVTVKELLGEFLLLLFWAHLEYFWSWGLKQTWPHIHLLPLFCISEIANMTDFPSCTVTQQRPGCWCWFVHEPFRVEWQKIPSFYWIVFPLRIFQKQILHFNEQLI